MRQASPLWEQILIFTLGPPVITCLWWLMSRGWAKGIQGSHVSDRTKRREKVGFWVLLCIMYAMGFAMFVYAHFIRH
jgi:hypothetical protein